MEDEWEIEIPQREEDEENLTKKQSDYINRLCASIGITTLPFETETLGKWQASELIDQLITIREEKEIDDQLDAESDEIFATRALNAKKKAIAKRKKKVIAAAIVFAIGFVTIGSVGEKHNFSVAISAIALASIVVMLWQSAAILILKLSKPR